MRHIRDKYEAIMKQISLNISKNEVLGPAFLLLPNNYKTVLIDFLKNLCQDMQIICIEVKPKTMENLTTLSGDSQQQSDSDNNNTSIFPKYEANF